MGRLERFLDEHTASAEHVCVSVETAHPAKFPDEIRAILGIEPEVPPALVGIEDKPEQYDTMTTDYAPFRDWLLKRFA